MPKTQLSPHDRFISSSMANPKIVQEFFENNLPAPIKAALDFSSIEPQKDSFIDDHLRMQIADLLYKVKFNGEEGYLYILAEHTSKPDKLLPFRLLKYMTAIMDAHLKKTKDSKLPLIYPLVLYTGKKPYKYSLDLFDLFGDQKEFAQKTLMAPYQLIDLTQVSDDEFRKYLWFGTMALMAKNIWNPNILPLFESLFETLRKLESQGESSYIKTIITYVFEAGKVPSNEAFVETIKKLETVKEGDIMTPAQHYKQEGKKEGIQQGLQQGKLERNIEIARKMLLKGSSIEMIAEVTELDVATIQKLVH